LIYQTSPLVKNLNNNHNSIALPQNVYKNIDELSYKDSLREADESLEQSPLKSNKNNGKATLKMGGSNTAK
jgi:hypothetical protein